MNTANVSRLSSTKSTPSSAQNCRKCPNVRSTAPHVLFAPFQKLGVLYLTINDPQNTPFSIKKNSKCSDPKKKMFHPHGSATILKRRCCRLCWLFQCGTFIEWKKGVNNFQDPEAGHRNHCPPLPPLLPQKLVWVLEERGRKARGSQTGCIFPRPHSYTPSCTARDSDSHKAYLQNNRSSAV